jgi:hypothetical protein
MMPWLSFAAVLVVGILSWNLYQRFGVDRIRAFNDKRRPGARMVGRGEFVDGNRHLQVALAVTPSTFFYENGDMEGSIDLQWVREVEYDTELATGTTPPTGQILRLRSNSQTFEFILPSDMIARWSTMLPPRGALEVPAMAQAVTV